ncbi:hypothetical protein DWQ65_03715 [Treponema phagedenis]|nr:hypothetical protein DWQ65_03715 [Treponema phagedenis]
MVSLHTVAPCQTLFITGSFQTRSYCKQECQNYIQNGYGRQKLRTATDGSGSKPTLFLYFFMRKSYSCHGSRITTLKKNG